MTRAAKHYSTEQALLDRGWKTRDGLWWPPGYPQNTRGLSFVNAIAWEVRRRPLLGPEHESFTDGIDPEDEPL